MRWFIYKDEFFSRLFVLIYDNFVDIQWFDHKKNAINF